MKGMGEGKEGMLPPFDQGELLFLDWADSEGLTLHLQG